MLIFLLIILGGVLGGLLTYFAKDYDIALDTSVRSKLDELPDFYRHARKTIKIATDFDPRFFNDERVKDGIEKAIENGVRIKFLYEGKRLPSKLSEWYEKQAVKNKIEIRRAEKLPSHLMVVDGCHLRLERPHELLKFGEKKGDVAFILRDFPALAGVYSQRFDDLWTKSS